MHNNKNPGIYDVIVIGAGHAGVEAALAASRLGCKTLLLTINLDTIAFMSCNPAIGGPAKSQLVKELDSLGGQMGIAADLTFLQMKTLNTTKGDAVHSLRAQSDRDEYHLVMKNILEEEKNLDLKQDIVDEILVDKEGKNIVGVRTALDVVYESKTVVVTTGTFLNGIIHTGMNHQEAGRSGELPAKKLSQSLEKIGLKLGRLKTGTPPRLNKRSLDFSRMKIQPGDTPPKMFSFTWEYRQYGLNIPENKGANLPQVPCYLTWTTPKTHEIIRANLDRSPLYSGKIQGIGPRYCPSIEDKVVRFPDKEKHQCFIEPTGRNTLEIYPQGLNTSLPSDVQLEMLRTMPGLENVEIIRPGYAVEYDYVPTSQLTYSLETRLISGLFCAGQINGTSGYEEAAALGIIAGINAAMKAKGREPLILRRDEAYIGTLIDDLITKDISEPYRMLTSRSEYRLLLRQDNADLRLTEKGYQIGLVSEERYKSFLIKKEAIKNNNLISKEIKEEIEISKKYAGYIDRQIKHAEKLKKLEEKKIPDWIDYKKIITLSSEARLKLSEKQPLTLGQAARIGGVSPADISVLVVYLEAEKRRNSP
ncbi:tRNA uridine-5-carboxymethylaminomethyl(34) synthesis enzyme MnmG [candidate division WOR-1 bacterium RIFOXYA2_FULL_37_7]|uniref:tRNA uridine 5-carboxymethylaminomethyl modification enzyme MnmG n=1 Tax=candidate division WOR-1 bacterium RIFOXYB2_FULL_37_13 TaxID=1802579 RepID=A0A1F4SM38_UNCSA|nr:MAG: tRNA uridine-5-carboxymethylaminomethyl(34) synthesis enzyme MnmG [candidate division WOR-1 bacterium RIFOXYA2_FULL_37_7]OGC21470.1 MAG: tRNA uridine-5-carboxymethylaminomethyl(34) synthesis enzyme MnmG [candidate division WOR-1 bacterium RIFOXYB2_FULL_37_13]